MSTPNQGMSHPTRGTVPLMQMSQHKRSLSFNHHLTYNQMKPTMSREPLFVKPGQNARIGIIKGIFLYIQLD